MDELRLTCIVCPMGCRLSVRRDGDDIEVTGHGCNLGPDYARQETLDPRRTVTSSVLVLGGEWPLASVRTAGPVPKARVLEVMDAIRGAMVEAPVRVGDVIIDDVAGTGTGVVATRAVRRRDGGA